MRVRGGGIDHDDLLGPDGRGVQELAPSARLARFEDLPAPLDHRFGEALLPAVAAD